MEGDQLFRKTVRKVFFGVSLILVVVTLLMAEPKEEKKVLALGEEFSCYGLRVRNQGDSVVVEYEGCLFGQYPVSKKSGVSRMKILSPASGIDLMLIPEANQQLDMTARFHSWFILFRKTKLFLRGDH